MDRRKFLKTSGLAIAAATTASMSSETTPKEDNVQEETKSKDGLHITKDSIGYHDGEKWTFFMGGNINKAIM